ncbi:hypothetical protein EV356DRAFT_507875 [Viridothelium virens]|uniref:Uncharacterized protein n=1 Tax=Viridothelium virens TaxID=1048519 RepID=A0A6A6H000_VIRVR|nr:hypothetical protein EV356DRAFT_507875 [Viridothelium virens]
MSIISIPNLRPLPHTLMLRAIRLGLYGGHHASFSRLWLIHSLTAATKGLKSARDGMQGRDAGVTAELAESSNKALALVRVTQDQSRRNVPHMTHLPIYRNFNQNSLQDAHDGGTSTSVTGRPFTGTGQVPNLIDTVRTKGKLLGTL